MEERFDIKKFFSGFFSSVSWAKDIKTFIIIGFILFGIFTVWKAWFLKQPKNVNKPTAIALPFSKIDKIDQASTQINVEPEKTWEIGFGGGVLRWDNRDGIGTWAWLRKRW